MEPDPAPPPRRLPWRPALLVAAPLVAVGALAASWDRIELAWRLRALDRAASTAEREAAVDDLRGLDRDAVIDALAARLDAPDPGVRDAAAWGLGMIGGPWDRLRPASLGPQRYQALLAKALARAEAFAQASGVAPAQGFPVAPGAPPALSRPYGVRVLALDGSTAAVGRLVRLVRESPDPEARRAAVEALGQIAPLDARGLGLLLELATSAEDPALRRAALRAALGLDLPAGASPRPGDDAETLAACRAALDAPDPALAVSAARGLLRAGVTGEDATRARDVILGVLARVGGRFPASAPDGAVVADALRALPELSVDEAVAEAVEEALVRWPSPPPDPVGLCLPTPWSEPAVGAALALTDPAWVPVLERVLAREPIGWTGDAFASWGVLRLALDRAVHAADERLGPSPASWPGVVFDPARPDALAAALTAWLTEAPWLPPAVARWDADHPPRDPAAHRQRRADRKARQYRADWAVGLLTRCGPRPAVRTALLRFAAGPDDALADLRREAAVRAAVLARREPPGWADLRRELAGSLAESARAGLPDDALTIALVALALVGDPAAPTDVQRGVVTRLAESAWDAPPTYPPESDPLELGVAAVAPGVPLGLAEAFGLEAFAAAEAAGVAAEAAATARRRRTDELAVRPLPDPLRDHGALVEALVLALAATGDPAAAERAGELFRGLRVFGSSELAWRPTLEAARRWAPLETGAPVMEAALRGPRWPRVADGEWPTVAARAGAWEGAWPPTPLVALALEVDVALRDRGAGASPPSGAGPIREAAWWLCAAREVERVLAAAGPPLDPVDAPPVAPPPPGPLVRLELDGVPPGALARALVVHLAEAGLDVRWDAAPAAELVVRLSAPDDGLWAVRVGRPDAVERTAPFEAARDGERATREDLAGRVAAEALRILEE